MSEDNHRRRVGNSNGRVDASAESESERRAYELKLNRPDADFWRASKQRIEDKETLRKSIEAQDRLKEDLEETKKELEETKEELEKLKRRNESLKRKIKKVRGETFG